MSGIPNRQTAQEVLGYEFLLFVSGVIICLLTAGFSIRIFFVIGVISSITGFVSLIFTFWYILKR